MTRRLLRIMLYGRVQMFEFIISKFRQDGRQQGQRRVLDIQPSHRLDLTVGRLIS